MLRNILFLSIIITLTLISFSSDIKADYFYYDTDGSELWVEVSDTMVAGCPIACYGLV
jgi:hypothetical protein